MFLLKSCRRVLRVLSSDGPNIGRIELPEITAIRQVNSG